LFHFRIVSKSDAKENKNIEIAKHCSINDKRKCNLAKIKSKKTSFDESKEDAPGKD